MIRRHCVIGAGAAGWVRMRISTRDYAWDLKKLNRPRPRQKGTRYRGFRYPEIGVAP